MASGFFYSIRALVDKNSFSEGKRELDKLTAASKKVALGVAGLAAGITAAAAIAGDAAQAEIKLANAVGMSTEKMAGWRNAVNMAGVSADGLMGTLSSLDTKMQHLKTGSVDMSLAKNLGMMGIGYGDFAGMDSEARMRAVFGQADQMRDQQLAATLVGDVLGNAGREYYESLKASGKSLSQQLAEGRALNFVSEKNRRDAAAFSAEFKGVKGAAQSILQMLGSEVAAVLTPTMRKVKGFLIQHRDEIRRGIQGAVHQAGAVFNAVAGALGKVAPLVSSLIDRFGGLGNVITRIGITFAAGKLASFARGLVSAAKGVNLVKAALGGIGGALMSGAFGLVMEDIIYYFGKGAEHSFIGSYLLPFLDKLKEKLKFEVNDGKLKGIAETFRKLWENAKAFGAVLKDIMPELGNLVWDNLMDRIRDIADAIAWVNELIDKFQTEGFGGGMKFIGESAWDGIKNLGEGIKNKAVSLWENGKAVIGGNKTLAEAAYDMSGDRAKGIMQKAGIAPVSRRYSTIEDVLKDTKHSGWSFEQENAYTAYMNQKDNPSAFIKGEMKKAFNLQDGIIAPGGRVIGVSPDDWVFAAKDVADLAAGLLPSGVVNNSTSSVSAPASYTINQSISVGGGARHEDVRAAAYRGTSEALRVTLVNASRTAQMMSGTR